MKIGDLLIGVFCQFHGYWDQYKWHPKEDVG